MKAWRAERGPDKEVVLAQRHRPGEAAQTDFTWATVCLSESLGALRKGVQRALFQLGRVPEWHQTDNSTATTHRTPNCTTSSCREAAVLQILHWLTLSTEPWAHHANTRITRLNGLHDG